MADLVINIENLIIKTNQFIRLYNLDYYNTERCVITGEYMGLPLTSKGHTIPIINKELITYCFRCLHDKYTKVGAKYKNKARMDEIRNFYEKNYKAILHEINLRDKLIIDNITQILDYQIDIILTNLEVNTKEHFIQHFRKFINKTIKTDDKDKLRKFKDSMFTINPVIEPEFQDWYDIHYKRIIPWNMKVSVQYDLKAKPFAYLNGLIYMNKILEAEGHKLFQPIPLRTDIIPKSILIDSTILIKYFLPKCDEYGNKIIKREWLKCLVN